MVSALGVMAGLVPAIHAGNASKTGPTWGAARSKVLQAQSFRPCRAHERSMRRTTWIAGTKPGHDALEFIRRSPHNPDSDDQLRTRQEPQCARAIGGDGLPVGSAHSVRVALVARSRRRHSDPSRRGPRRARPISWLGSSRAGHKVAAVKRREFFARCALASIHLN